MWASSEADPGCRVNSPEGPASPTSKGPAGRGAGSGLQATWDCGLSKPTAGWTPLPEEARPPHPVPWAGGPHPCLINTRSGRLLLCSVSSQTVFMSNPPRRSPEGFEVSGCTNKDVTLAHTELLNEDGFDVEAVARGKWPGLPAAGGWGEPRLEARAGWGGLSLAGPRKKGSR